MGLRQASVCKHNSLSNVLTKHKCRSKLIRIAHFDASPSWQERKIKVTNELDGLYPSMTGPVTGRMGGARRHVRRTWIDFLGFQHIQNGLICYVDPFNTIDLFNNCKLLKHAKQKFILTTQELARGLLDTSMFKAPLHQFGQEGLDLSAWSPTGGYLIT